MLFRIMTNGVNWIVQRKKFFRWSTESTYDGCYGSTWRTPRRFTSDREAVTYIRNTYGSSAAIDRPMVPSMAAYDKELPKTASNKQSPKRVKKVK